MLNNKNSSKTKFGNHLAINNNPWDTVVSLIDIKDKTKERMKEVILLKRDDYKNNIKY